jgi:hypothetical protein
MGDCGAYIGAVTERQAIKPRGNRPLDRVIPPQQSLTQFHHDELSLN